MKSVGSLMMGLRRGMQNTWVVSVTDSIKRTTVAFATFQPEENATRETGVC